MYTGWISAYLYFCAFSVCCDERSNAVISVSVYVSLKCLFRISLAHGGRNHLEMYGEEKTTRQIIRP